LIGAGIVDAGGSSYTDLVTLDKGKVPQMNKCSHAQRNPPGVLTHAEQADTRQSTEK
jgi:hypothetical protein